MKKIDFFVFLTALAIGIYSQFPALVNKYVISDDVRQHIYWMQQFRDGDLFKNDLLTEFAKHYQPWGFVFLYYILSSIIAPLMISKTLTVPIFAISALYIFKLVKHIANDYAGFLAALIFMITPIFLDRIVGAHPRAFGYPLLVMFLYYLIKKEELKLSLVLVLQCLFYPMIFLLSTPTYLFTFLKIRQKKISIDWSISNRKFFVVAVLIGVSLLSARHLFTYNPDIGRPVTREQMIEHPEYYSEGRYKVLPTSPFDKKIDTFFEKVSRKYLNNNLILDSSVILIIIILLLAVGRFPREILFLFLSSVFMYIMADLLLARLFLPKRYIDYSIPLIGLIIIAVVVDRSIRKLNMVKLKRASQIGIIAGSLLLFLFKINKRPGLVDMSAHNELYEYVRSLPKNTMIAAHPDLADGIPTFAQRKVLFNYELSNPIFDNYWETVKGRTFAFFHAYYSGNLSTIYKFCEENGIDYLIVNTQHFTKEYLAGDIYFEPFDTYIKNLTKKRQEFALTEIPAKAKLFIKGEIFVINKEVVKAMIGGISA